MEGKPKVKVGIEVWAIPSEGVTLDDLIAKFQSEGKTVLQIDRDNNRLLIEHKKG